MHAWELTNPAEGTLTAVASTSFTQYDDPRSRALFSLVCQYRADTPTIYAAGMFKASGTSVQTMLLPLMKRDMSWREQPYQGYPDWHCATLDFWIHQTESLYRQYWDIWEQIDQGVLEADPDQPAWEDTRRMLRPIFTEAINFARKDWIDIHLTEARLRYLEHHFLAQGELGYQRKQHAAPMKERKRRSTHACIPLPSSTEQVAEPVSVEVQTIPEMDTHTPTEADLSSLNKCMQLALFPA